MRRFVAIALFGLVAACGGAEPVANNSVDNAVAGNVADTIDYQAEVIKLPLEARQGVFMRAIRDAGLACQEVTASERLEDRKGDPTWRAYCGKVPHIISITKDGTANIASRTN